VQLRELNGAPVPRVAAERRRRIDEPFPGGESYRQVVDRTREFLADLVADWDGRRVLLVAHSANLWALEVLLHGRDLYDVVGAPFTWQEGWRYRVEFDVRRSSG
jgi:broad specificity phosphatase PhoE